MRTIFLGIIFLLMTFSPLVELAVPTFAAKPRLSRSKTQVSAGRVGSSVKFKANRLGLILSLSGLRNATSVSYQLTYNTDGIAQGVIGTIKPTKDSETRELLFGTCSAGVCRYHANITDARLVVTSKLKSGLTIRKPYRIKV